MKILQFGKFYYPVFGGMERAMYEITEGLNARDIQCDVLCSNTRAVEEISKFDGYTVYRAASYGLLNSTPISPRLVTNLKKLSGKYDILHVHHPDPMAFLALYLVRPSAKVIIHWQSDIVRQELMLKLFLPLQNWVLRRADRIIVASDAYAQHSPYLAAYLDKVEVIPNGISDEKLQANEEKVETIRERYKEKKIVLAFGRLVAYKGFRHLIDAAKFLGDDYQILIGGGGPEAEMLQEKIDTLKLGNKVQLLGHIAEEEKYDYFQAASIFCLPSVTKAEAFGIVLLEAMAFGKPIVSSKIESSGMVWVNQDQVTGLQVPPGSPVELAKAIKKITNDPELYQTFSQNGRERYLELFTQEKMLDSLQTLYTKLLDTKDNR